MLTNVDSTFAGSSFLQFKNGTLTTTGDTEIRVGTNGFGGVGAAPFIVGMSTVNGDAFTWNILGGTTKLLTSGALAENGNAFYISGGPSGFNGDWRNGRGIVNVSGPSTVFTNNNWVQIGRSSYRLPAQLNISNGAKMYTAGTAYIGWSSANNTVVVNGSNSLWSLGGSVVIGKNSTGGNMLVVTNGGRVAASGMGIEEGGKLCKLIVTGTNSSFVSTGNAGFGTTGQTNLILIANGASFYNSGGFQFGKNSSNYSPGNEIRVAGAGSTFTNMGNISMEGSNGYLRVSAGGQAYALNGVAANVNGRIEVTDPDSSLSWGGCAVSKSCSVIVSNGAAMAIRNGTVWIATGGIAGADKLASLIVTGPGSRLTAANSYQFYFGIDGNAQVQANSGGQISLADPATGTSWGFTIGYGAGKTGTVEVAGAGSEISFSATGTGPGQYGAVRVGDGGVGRLVVTNRATFGFYSRSGLSVGSTSGSAGSTVLVADGGLLDFRRQPDNPDGITVGNFAGNSVSNIGGIFQFAFTSPNINPGAFGNVVVSGGTIAFTKISDADVKGNWTGTLTNILFQGDNTFRLNAATNVNAASQAYTFAAGLGATNYVNLELLNGSCYRGGDVTIGAGGSLTVTGGVAAVSGNLTFQPGGTYRVTLNSTNSVDRVAVGGNVNLGGATLDLRLTAPPQKDYPYVLLDNAGPNPVSGQFATGSVIASYGGTSYVLDVRTGGGSGNDVVAGWFTKGTMILVW
jgi:T5SS/PEP-CTERM-associated repeat protein